VSKLTSSTQLSSVTVIERRGLGPVYRATLSLQDLYMAIRRATIRYAPRYQRGFRKWSETSEDDLDLLLPIHDEQLQIQPERACMMAVKYLLGRLYSAHVTWNARREPGVPPPYVDDEQGVLHIHSTITVPDTAHRHRAYYLLVHWKHHPDEIPAKVTVDGQDVSREQIGELLSDFDPASEHVHVDIYVLDAEQEGFLYDEFNAEAKPPPTSVAISLNPTKTPSRRFVATLMANSALFSPHEIETRGNTIGSKSRKLTTIATLEAAARAMCKQAELNELEGTEGYEDLVDFVGAFFEEWAKQFPEFLPGTSAAERHALRENSFALSNVMFHPLFRLAYDLWRPYFENEEDWRKDPAWRDALAQLGRTIETNDPDTSKRVKWPVMHRENPDWRGKVLVPRFNADGTRAGFIISSTRQTRDAAYAYLRQRAGLGGGKAVAA
jgi:DNA-sulfur modification-associated